MTRCLRRPAASGDFGGTPADRTFRFMLIEDDEDHAHLVAHHLRHSNVRNEVTSVRDGETALSYLRREVPFTEAPRPDLILLDLKLPKLDGHEVLAAIKQDPALKEIPVVILSTSSAASDRERAWRAHADSYLVKPLDGQQFRELLDELSRHWREMAPHTRRDASTP